MRIIESQTEGLSVTKHCSYKMTIIHLTSEDFLYTQVCWRTADRPKLCIPPNQQRQLIGLRIPDAMQPSGSGAIKKENDILLPVCISYI